MRCYSEESPTMKSFVLITDVTQAQLLQKKKERSTNNLLCGEHPSLLIRQDDLCHEGFSLWENFLLPVSASCAGMDLVTPKRFARACLRSVMCIFCVQYSRVTALGQSLQAKPQCPSSRCCFPPVEATHSCLLPEICPPGTMMQGTGSN